MQTTKKNFYKSSFFPCSIAFCLLCIKQRYTELASSCKENTCTTQLTILQSLKTSSSVWNVLSHLYLSLSLTHTHTLREREGESKCIRKVIGVRGFDATAIMRVQTRASCIKFDFYRYKKIYRIVLKKYCQTNWLWAMISY